MQIIPVIDIRNGVVVRAVAGDRARYRPLVSPLVSPIARAGEPNAIVEALSARFAFDTLYIADLDAIERRGSNDDLIASLSARHPDLGIWLDAGLRNADDVAKLIARAHFHAVIGTESFTDIGALAALRDEPHAVLSLDFRGDAFLGASEALARAAHWPSRVIVMSLARVGLGQGPDFARLAEIVARAGGRRIYAAGGVRGAADLERLDEIGVAGALVASALHDGALLAT